MLSTFSVPICLRFVPSLLPRQLAKNLHTSFSVSGLKCKISTVGTTQPPCPSPAASAFACVSPLWILHWILLATWHHVNDPNNPNKLQKVTPMCKCGYGSSLPTPAPANSFSRSCSCSVYSCSCHWARFHLEHKLEHCVMLCWGKFLGARQRLLGPRPGVSRRHFGLSSSTATAANG